MENHGDGTYTLSFEFVDDKGYTWDGEWTGNLNMTAWAPRKDNAERVNIQRQRIEERRAMNPLTAGKENTTKSLHHSKIMNN